MELDIVTSALVHRSQNEVHVLFHVRVKKGLFLVLSLCLSLIGMFCGGPSYLHTLPIQTIIVSFLVAQTFHLTIWYQANQLGNVDQMDKAAKYHNWVALPLRLVTVDGPPFSVPRYLHLDLGKQTQRNMARFRLHSHAL